MEYLSSVGEILLVLIALSVCVYGVFVMVTHPSNDRDWSPDQMILPYAEILGNNVTLYNIRNFSYKSVSDYTPAYYDKIFNLTDLKNVYFVLEPFAGYGYAAHTFLSFEFEGGHFVSISIEIRKKRGDSFSPWKGLFRQYELMYVVADERDVVKLRSNHRKDNVYVYPVVTTPEKAQALFMDMIKSINRLKERPEFYNTITNNCATNIAKHINTVSPGRAPWSHALILSQNADVYAHRLGFIDNALSVEELRAKHLINNRAAEHADSSEFSLRIRGR